MASMADSQRMTVGKAAAKCGHFVWCAVVVTRQANHQRNGLPFLKQSCDSGKTYFILFVVNCGERLGGSRYAVPDRNTNTLSAEIKTDDPHFPPP